MGNFPSPCGAHSVSCLLDEATLLRQWPVPAAQPSDAAVKNFRYFVAAEGTILLSVLEQPLTNDQGPSL